MSVGVFRRPWQHYQRPRVITVPAAAGGGGGGGPIVIRGTTPATAIGTVGAAGAISVTLTGTRQPQTGDLLVIIHGNDFYALSNMPTPSVGGSTTGVTNIVDVDQGSNQSHTRAWYKIVSSTGDLTVSVTETGTGDEERYIAVYVLSGTDTAASPIDGTPTSGGATVGNASHVLPAVTTANTDSFLIAGVSPGPNAGGTGYTPPGSPWVEDYDADAGSGFIYTGGHQQLSASGSTGTRTFTLVGATSEWSGVMFAIKTASAAAPDDIPEAPQRTLLQFRDYGETPWLQRKNFSSIDQPAAPDVIPSVPPQAPRSADAAGQPWLQRAALVDQSSAAGVEFDPTQAGYAFDVAATHQRLPWLRIKQQQYDQSSAAAAVAYDPTLAPPHRDLNAYVDRRVAPLQRSYFASPDIVVDVGTGRLGAWWSEDSAPFYIAATMPRYPVPAAAPGTPYDPTLAPPYRNLNDHTDRRLVPQQRKYFSSIDVVVSTPFDPTQAGYGPRHVWRRDPYAPTQRSAILNPDDVDTVGTGATMGWWGVDDTAHHFNHWLPMQSDPNLFIPPVLADPLILVDSTQRDRVWFARPWFGLQRTAVIDQSSISNVSDPTQAGYGPRWMWYRPPAIPQQRELESVYGLLDVALLEVPPPLSIAYGLAATQQRLPWLRIKQQQYDQSVPPIVTDFDPTQGGGYGQTWRWWYRPPVAPVQRERESDPGLLNTALLEDALLGSRDDLIRHQAWFARPWFGLQRPARIDQSTAPAPDADPTQAGYGPRWMWYRPPVAPVQRDRKSDPRLLLSALLEDVLLGGWDDTLRHRTWYVDRREVPQQRSYPDALQPIGDPLLIGGAEWRYKLIPVTHRARWVLRQWWQQKAFQGADPLLFQGTVAGGVLSGASITGAGSLGGFITGFSRDGYMTGEVR